MFCALNLKYYLIFFSVKLGKIYTFVVCCVNTFYNFFTIKIFAYKVLFYKFNLIVCNIFIFLVFYEKFYFFE